MINEMPPRIRGKIGQATEPDDVKGKWFYEISLWSFDGETQLGDPFGPFGPFETRVLAADALEHAAKNCAQIIEREQTGKVSGKYLDFKNGGVMRKWGDKQ